MAEYGNGVGQVAGQAAGSGGANVVGGHPNGDWGAQLGQFASDTVNAIVTMQPWQLLLLGIVIVAGVMFIRRAI
jgi:hypothetical protein